MSIETGVFRPLAGTFSTYTTDFDGSESESHEPRYLDQGSWRRESNRTPLYFKKLRNKEPLPMNGFFYRKDQKFLPSGSRTYTITRKSDGKSRVEVTTGPVDVGLRQPEFSTEGLNALDARAVNKILSKLKNQKVNVAVALAEGHKTLQMIAQTATAFGGAVRWLKQGSVYGAASALGVPLKRKAQQAKGVANQWLALQYGWLPLANDLYESVGFFARQMNWVVRSKVSARASGVETQKYETDEILGYTTDVVSATGTVVYTVHFSEPAGGTPATELGLTNPLSVAWELVPYSFIVDWFLPIGDYLNSLDATRGLTFDKACKTTFIRGTSTRTESGKMQVDMGDNIESLSLFREARLETIRCTRVPLGTFPSASLPSFKSPLGVKHALNALALMTQRFRS